MCLGGTEWVCGCEHAIPIVMGTVVVETHCPCGDISVSLHLVRHCFEVQDVV